MPQSTDLVRLRFAEFDRLTALRGWDTDAKRAREIGISQATLSNLRAGRTQPGRKVIDRCLLAFGASFYDVLFERVEAEPVSGVAS